MGPGFRGASVMWVLDISIEEKAISECTPTV